MPIFDLTTNTWTGLGTVSTGHVVLSYPLTVSATTTAPPLAWSGGTGAGTITVSGYNVRVFDCWTDNNHPLPQPSRPPEAVAAREARLAELRGVRATAICRARDILLAVLNDEQIASYLHDEYFDVVGSAGGLYRIKRGNAGNVYYLDPAPPHAWLGRLCAHPTMAEHWLPDQDVALAQMLAIQADEPGFAALANVHAGVRPPCARRGARGLTAA